MNKTPREPSEYIVPININGLEGRMMRMPARTKTNREILFIYGQHSSLERWWGISQELNKLGAVTVPDLPGLGGMTSMYKIGKQPSIDAMAEYLASFFKLKYHKKPVTVVAMSLGFVIVTRMLQLYPETAKKVDFLISIVGFARHDDLKFSPSRIWFYRQSARIFSRKLPSRFFRYTVLQPLVLRQVYHRTRHAKEKFAELAGDEFQRNMETEINLWHSNDVRTQFKHYLEMFSLDNTKVQVPLPVYHVAAKRDRYFDNTRVEEHMRCIFTDFQIFYTKVPNHAPTVIATADEAASFVPEDLRKIIKAKRIIK